jgi:FKBP-type peptidyl-prolyl cis-trans isomerase FkpA
MKKAFAAVLTAGLATLLLAGAGITRAAETELATEEQKMLYALGVAVSRNLTPFGLSPADLEIVKSGINDGVLNRSHKVEMQVYGPKLQAFAQTRSAASAEREKKASASFLAKASAEPGVKKTESGAIVKVLKEGAGPTPKAGSTVRVHYHGTLTDGTVFDSSVKRGEPTTFALSSVIKCWSEGVQQIKVGGKSRLVCPSESAYGDRGSPPTIKPGATLVFEVELLEIMK